MRYYFSRHCDCPVPRRVAVTLVALLGLACGSLACHRKTYDESEGIQICEMARSGDLTFAKMLLRNDPDLAMSEDRHGCTPLHFAAANGYIEMVKLLLANKANVNAKCSVKTYWVKLDPSYSNVRPYFLGDWGPWTQEAWYPPDLLDGVTPSHLAAWYGHKDVVALLLANKAEVDVKANNGATLLHYAAGGGYVDIEELLLANKAEVNAKDNVGDTPLHYAASTGKWDVAMVLLENKAEVDARDNKGETPLHRAVSEAPNADRMVSAVPHCDSLPCTLRKEQAGGYADVENVLRQHGGHE